MPFAATCMDIEIIILSVVSQIKKDKYYLISPICGILINDTNELIYITDRYRKETYGYQKRRGDG